MFNFLRF